MFGLIPKAQPRARPVAEEISVSRQSAKGGSRGQGAAQVQRGKRGVREGRGQAGRPGSSVSCAGTEGGREGGIREAQSQIRKG